MASVVEVMARFSADTSSFRRNVDASADSMRRMRAQADDMAKQTERSMGGMQAKAVALGTIVGNLAVMGFQRLGAGVVGLGQAVLGQAMNMQQAEMAFNSFLGSAEKSKAFLDELAKFAAKTPFEFPELVDASKQMMAFGFQANQILPMMTAIGDAAAGLGTGAEGIERITRQLGQMKMKGVAAGEELRVIAESGVPAWQYLADTMGVTVPEAMKMVEKRLVSADTAIAAITEGLEKGTKNARGFGGMMEQQSKTLQGVISTFKDSVMNSLVKAAKPIVEILTQVVVAITPVAEGLAQGIGGALEKVTPMLLSFFKALAGIGAVFKAIPGPVYAVVAALVLWNLSVRASAAAMGRLAGPIASTQGFLSSLAATWRAVGAAAMESTGKQMGAMARLKAMATVMSGGAKASNGLKAAGGALMGMLGGPWGIAMAGATLAIGGYMQAQQNAQAAVDALTGSLDSQTGAMTAASLQQIAEALSTDIASEDWERLPFTIEEVTAAIAKGGPELDTLNQRLAEFADANTNLGGEQAKVLSAARGLQSSIQNQGEVVYDSRIKWEAFNAATKAAESVAESIAPTVDGVTMAQDRLKEATAATTAAMKAFEDQWSILQGILDRGAAIDNWKSSLREMKQQFKDLAEQHKGDARGMAEAQRAALRSMVEGLATYAKGFKDPEKQAKAFADGILVMKQKAIANGMKRKDADAFFGKFDSFTKGLFTTAGKAGAAGMAQGIAEGATLAAIQAAKMANSAKVAAMAALDAHSPSRVFIKIGHYIGAGLVKGMEESTNKAAKAATRMAQAAIDAFKQKASDAVSLAESVADSMRSAGSITSAQAGEDGPLGVDQVIQTMRDNLDAAKRFLANVKALKAAGLNSSSVADIINAGVEQGGATAAALLSGGAGAVSQANSMQSQLNATAAALGSLAAQNKYGLTTSQAKAAQNITIEKGGVSVNFNGSVTRADRMMIEDLVDKAVTNAVRKVMKESKR
jgi:tape measure domain-containing protein